jgi:hypothetical protein
VEEIADEVLGGIDAPLRQAIIDGENSGDAASSTWMRSRPRHADGRSRILDK